MSGTRRKKPNDTTNPHRRKITTEQDWEKSRRARVSRYNDFIEQTVGEDEVATEEDGGKELTQAMSTSSSTRDARPVKRKFIHKKGAIYKTKEYL